jgi:hypothetical protein
MPAIINEFPTTMTAENPRPQPEGLSPEVKRVRDEKWAEIVNENRELEKELKEARDLLHEATYRIRETRSDLPHWTQHKKEIMAALSKTIAVMKKSVWDFYPNDETGDALIDAIIERDRRQNPA